jgi:hypothetical protein
MQRSLDDVTVRDRSELRARADANAQISMLYDLAQANGIRTDMVDAAARRVMPQFDYNRMGVQSGACCFNSSDGMFKTFQLFIDGMPLDDAYARSMGNTVNASEYQSGNSDSKPSSQEVSFKVEDVDDVHVPKDHRLDQYRESSEMVEPGNDDAADSRDAADVEVEKKAAQVAVNRYSTANGVANAVFGLMASDRDILGDLTYGEMPKVTEMLASAVDATVPDDKLSESAMKIRSCVLSRFGSKDGQPVTLETMSVDDLNAVRIGMVNVEKSIESSLLTRTMSYINQSQDTVMSYQPYPLMGMRAISNEMADMFISETESMPDESKREYEKVFVNVLRDALTGDSDASKREWSAANAPDDASPLELRLRECGDVFRVYFDRMRMSSGKNGRHNDYAYEWGCAGGLVSDCVNAVFPVDSVDDSDRLLDVLDNDKVMTHVVKKDSCDIPDVPMGAKFDKLCERGRSLMMFMDGCGFPSIEFDGMMCDAVDADLKESHVSDFIKGDASVGFTVRHTGHESDMSTVVESERVVNAEEQQVDVSVPGVEDLRSSDNDKGVSMDR